MRRTIAGAAALAVVAAAAWAGTSPADADVYDAPASIVSDCTVDVTAALQTWLNSVPDGATARLALGGCYNTEGPILLRNRAGLTVDGNGSTLQAFTDGSGTTPPDPYFNPQWPRKRTRVTVLGGSGVTIRGVVLRGGSPYAGVGDLAYDPDLEAQHGVEFIQHSAGSFVDSQVYDMWGDFAYMDQVDQVTISGNVFRRNGRQGVALTAGTNVYITGNDMAEMRRSTFDIEANVDNAVIDNVHIEGNTTGHGRLLWLANGGQSWHISNIYVKNNVMADYTGVPVIHSWNNETGGKRGPWFVEGNTFKVGGSPQPGLLFVASTDVHVKNNSATFPVNRNMTAVDLRDVPYAEVAKNTFTGNKVDVKQRCTC